MTQRTNERVAYHNGEIKPESRVLVSFRDRGFTMGEAVFDTARTVRHKPFKLEEHVDRLFRSMRYLQIDAGLGRDEFVSISHEVLERNLHLIAPDEDYWLFQRVSPGVRDPFFGEEAGEPTVIVECTPLPLKARAPLFRDGVRVRIPATRRTPPDAMSPRAKTHNYINLQLADREVRAQDPQAWAILLDHDGNIAEGLGSNIFFVRDGELLTPRARFVLPGISRETVFDLAGEEGHRGARDRPRPVRRFHLRRVLPDLDEPVHGAGVVGQRPPGRRRSRAGTGHHAARRSLQAPARLRLRGAVHQQALIRARLEPTRHAPGRRPWDRGRPA